MNYNHISRLIESWTKSGGSRREEVRQTGRLPAAVRERSPRSHERAAEIEPRASPRARNELFLYIDLHTLNGDKLAKIIRCKP